MIFDDPGKGGSGWAGSHLRIAFAGQLEKEGGGLRSFLSRALPDGQDPWPQRAPNGPKILLKMWFLASSC